MNVRGRLELEQHTLIYLLMTLCGQQVLSRPLLHLGHYAKLAKALQDGGNVTGTLVAKVEKGGKVWQNRQEMVVGQVCVGGRGVSKKGSKLEPGQREWQWGCSLGQRGPGRGVILLT